MKTRRWILLAEDNPNDAELTIRALVPDQSAMQVVVTQDGEETLDCLYRRGEFKDRPADEPALVLLDLKMPRTNGFEVLQEIKSDPHLKLLPVVVFSSSREDADILHSYELGANAFVVKPLSFQEFAASLKAIGAFWIEVNELPLQVRKTKRASEPNPAQPAEMTK